MNKRFSDLSEGELIKKGVKHWGKKQVSILREVTFWWDSTLSFLTNMARDHRKGVASAPDGDHPEDALK